MVFKHFKTIRWFQRKSETKRVCTDCREYEQVRKIGEDLNENGGFRLMRQVGERFAARNPQHARLLESVWDGIGSWMG
jgi:hypothetical protein